MLNQIGPALVSNLLDLIEEYLAIGELPVPKREHHQRCVHQYLQGPVIEPVISLWRLPVKVSEL